MKSTSAPAHPGLWATVSAPSQSAADRKTLTLHLPTPAPKNTVSGLFYLARCGIEDPADRFSDWNTYAPVALNAIACVARPDGSEWTFLLPEAHKPGARWLATRDAHDKILLLGPYGNRLDLPLDASRRNLLVITDSARFLPLLSTVHAVLDQGGRVTMLGLATGDDPGLAALQTLTQLLPLQVEVQRAGLAPEDQDSLTAALRWADAALIAVAARHMYTLAYRIRMARFQDPAPPRNPHQTDTEFAYVLTQADMLCGYGACLACTVPTASGGVTRACLHGPIFPLSRLA